MIEHLVIPSIATYLGNQNLDFTVLAEQAAYPDSGANFLRIEGAYNDIDQKESTFHIRVGFTLTISQRVRTKGIQTRKNAYTDILQTASKCFRALAAKEAALDHLRTAFPYATYGITVYERFLNESYNTNVEPVFPPFYGSKDYSSDEPAGYMLQHNYVSPVFILRLDCLDLIPEQNTLLDA